MSSPSNAREMRPLEVRERVESSVASVEVAARRMHDEGSRHVAELKSTLQDLHAEVANTNAAPEVRARIQALTQEVDEAWEDLTVNLSAATAGERPKESEVFLKAQPRKQEEEELDWEIQESGSQAEASVEQKLQNMLEGYMDTGKLPGASFTELVSTETVSETLRAWVQDQVFSSLLQHRVGFQKFEQLIVLADSSLEVRTQLAEQLQEYVGKKYADRLMADEKYRKTLAEVQEQLSGSLAEGGPDICQDPSDIKKLVLVHELLGTNIHSIAATMNLGSYSSELQINLESTKSVLSILEPDFDKVTGECSGKVIMTYQYGEEGDRGARIERTFGRTKVGEGVGTGYEKVCNLDRIHLPNELKGKSVGSLEVEATEHQLKESGFDAVSLHANIDMGGYVWAIKGFGWDIDAMRSAKKSNERKSQADIVVEFMLDRFETFKKNLSDSEIDLTDPELVSILQEFQRCLENPLAVTPQRLAGIGREGPFFVQAESGMYYRQKLYTEEKQNNDPPRQNIKGKLHAGKMFLIGSDWYGKKNLKQQ